jgi:hypothetical protein
MAMWTRAVVWVHEKPKIIPFLGSTRRTIDAASAYYRHSTNATFARSTARPTATGPRSPTLPHSPREKKPAPRPGSPYGEHIKYVAVYS